VALLIGPVSKQNKKLN